MGPAFSLEIENLQTHEVRSVLVSAGWADESADVYRRWCDCGAAGYFLRGHVDDGKFVDYTTERHEAGARKFLETHKCDHQNLTRFKFLRAKLQDGRTIEIASPSAKDGKP